MGHASRDISYSRHTPPLLRGVPNDKIAYLCPQLLGKPALPRRGREYSCPGRVRGQQRAALETRSPVCFYTLGLSETSSCPRVYCGAQRQPTDTVLCGLSCGHGPILACSCKIFGAAAARAGRT